MAWWQQFSLRSKIVALTTVLVLCSFATGLLLMGYNILGAVVTELGRRAMSVARTVAQVEAVRQNLGQSGGAQAIQPAVERMRLATGVEYIVTFDMDRADYLVKLGKVKLEMQCGVGRPLNRYLLGKS